MAVLEATILLILLVIISNIISHYLVSIPTALIEIAVGVIAAVTLNLTIELQTDWFMLLLVAPLLYSDAKHFPKKELWELRVPIFANAILLVFITTIAGGYLINAFIPEVSLPLAFALAAVLSPTDPVAVQGIAEQVKLPKKILSLISGESLINDASGLIAFKYALAAFLTGYFSLQQAAGDFLYVTFFGVVIGLVLARVIYLIQVSLLRQGIQDVVLHSLIQVLTPFVIFIAAEVIHASGVIAVVVAGVVAIQQEPLYKRGPFSEIQIVTNKLWDILIYLLNGIVFVVLGAILPFVMHAAIINPSINNGLLILYVIIIWLILMIIRTLWSYAYMWYDHIRTSKSKETKPKFSTAVLTGLTGVRGAVTMAMVLSIPFFLPDGEIFQERYLIIFLASGVILMSLLVAVVTIPFFTKQKKRIILTGDDVFQEIQHKEDDNSALPEVEARKLMTKKVISMLRSEQDSDNRVVVNDLLRDFDKQLRFLYLDDDSTSNEFYHDLETQYRKIAVESEKKGAIEVIEANNLPKQLTKNYLEMLDYKMRAHSTNFKILFRQYMYRTRRKTKRLVFQTFLKKQKHSDDAVKNITTLETDSSKYAVRVLKELKDDLDQNDRYFILKSNIINQIIMEYESKINRIKNYRLRQEDQYQTLYQDYFLRALDEERTVIQTLLEQGRISPDLASLLRQSVNYSETSFLQGSLSEE
ncbi:Na+/H+ antiporter [Vagococcus jeotgali]|uniref:Na+/H+ antiporter n=1 Tax=Vagococcus jeotgali TaxID=3109030 RepID=UPI002DD8F76F|nr:Na+/H+ antiporter [Vagococcus sp. B2T-5]